MTSANKNVLDILFGAPLRVRLMRFFLLNTHAVFTLAGLQVKTKVTESALKKELQVLLKAGCIKKTKATEKVFSSGKKKKSKHVQGFAVDPKFPYLLELHQLFVSVVPSLRAQIGKHLKTIGKPRVVVISGIFLDQPAGFIDLLLVGDEIKKRKLEILLKRFERELGKDIVYAVLPVEEFEFRYGMRDKFIEDIFTNPHEVILDELHLIERGA